MSNDLTPAERRMPHKAVYQVVGAIYILIGACLLWYYIFTLMPVMDERAKFDSFATECTHLAQVRDAARALIPQPDSKSLSIFDPILQLIKPVFPSISMDRLRVMFAIETPLERLQKKANDEYARKGQPIGSSQSAGQESKGGQGSPVDQGTKTTSPAKAEGSPVDQGIKTSSPAKVDRTAAPAPNSWTFLMWLQEAHEDVYNNWYVQDLARMSVSAIALRAFLLLGLALGLLGGGMKLWRVATRDKGFNIKHIVIPLTVPVISIVSVLLLTGFGPVFSGPLDSATSRLLVVVTAVISLGPEDFLAAMQRYLREVLKSNFGTIDGAD